MTNKLNDVNILRQKGVVFNMFDHLLEQKDKIKILLLNDVNFIESLSSEEIFQILITFRYDEEIRPLIEANADKILKRCSIDYDMFNCFTIMTMKASKINVEHAEECLEKTIKTFFGKDSIIYLMKLIVRMQKKGVLSKEELFKLIIEDLKDMPTDKSSKILFDLYIFPDFNLLLNTHYRVVATLIEAYQLYEPEIISSNIFNGSTIISKLLYKENEAIVAKYLRDLLQEKQISTRNIKMVGGGGSCLVFKINEMVIKLGEERNNRKVYINHRILASALRKLEYDSNGNELFYVEIMKYVMTGDVTREELLELRSDLYSQGLIWTDDKLANCGVLAADDENYYDVPIDYSEYAGHINNPIRREEFLKRKRKIVVIDNDHITFNPLKSCK